MRISSYRSLTERAMNSAPRQPLARYNRLEGRRSLIMPTVIASHIRLDEEGVAWIEGTTTKVIEVVLNKIASGLSPEELQAELPHLSLAQVYAALAYHYAH